jgi:glycosyltransferase involved in cell wall biosynthesis
MRVAVITPYYREDQNILRKCHESVRQQTHPCAHFMVADGFPREEISRWEVEHFILPKAHGDSGNTPRGIGSLSAMNQGYDAIAYLDADNWFYSNHIGAMVDLYGKTGAAVCTASRTIHRWDESLMFVDRQDSDGAKDLLKNKCYNFFPDIAENQVIYKKSCNTYFLTGPKHVDTSCLFLTRSAFQLLPLWVMMPKELGPICDRVMWQAILARGITHAHHPQPTVAFRTQYQFHYALLKETPPPGTKSHDESVGKAVKWWNSLSNEARAGWVRCFGSSSLNSPIAEQISNIQTGKTQPATFRNPLVSVVMPVHNGAATLERALRSVVSQSFVNWELLTVDDASTDGSKEVLQSWAAKDARVKPIFLPENKGPSSARNAALKNASGEFITYLDSDDEYHADYLEHVARRRDKGDVLVFGYDMIYDDGPLQGQGKSWSPALVHRDLFARGLATPLGIAHRRKMLDKTGGFHEGLWKDEDMDLWKRMARAGAEFRFFAIKSGRYHVRAASLSRTPRLTHPQREAVLANYRINRPIFSLCEGDSPIFAGRASMVPGKLEQSPKRPVRKVAFVSPHCLVDFTNGAATATLDGLQLLQSLGFECQVFCSSRLDAWEEVRLEDTLARQRTPFEVRNVRIGQQTAPMLFTSQGKVPVTVFKKASNNRQWQTPGEANLFLAACKSFLTQNRPDVVWTYGGDPASRAIHRLVKQIDIPLVFFLHNFAYTSPEPFRLVDYALVPSQYARRFYWERIGLACQMLPLVIDPRRTQVEQRNPRFVTFVNPEPRKGIHVFAQIAEVLAQRRPDIPLLMVEGVSRNRLLPKLGVNLSGLKNLTIMPNTPDPRSFYTLTKLLLMPSLMENVGFCAIEAMLNGIPVLGSNRGALPETLGEVGFRFDIPERYTTRTCAIPTEEEVEPWIETIIRLWDNPSEYQSASEIARRHAQQWTPERMAPIYKEFFSGIGHQPGPPLVPMQLVNG